MKKTYRSYREIDAEVLRLAQGEIPQISLTLKARINSSVLQRVEKRLVPHYLEKRRRARYNRRLESSQKETYPLLFGPASHEEVPERAGISYQATSRGLEYLKEIEKSEIATTVQT